MAAMLPMAVFGLEVPPGGIPISGRTGIESAFRITMAAIDPDAVPEGDGAAAPRATLKIIRSSNFFDDSEDDDDSESDFDVNAFEREMLRGDSDEEDSEEDSDDEAGPSDKAARKAAAQAAITKLLAQEDMDVDEDSEEDETPNGVNGVKKSAKALGKMPANDSNEDEDEDSDDMEFEELVVCTLDPNKNWQQPLDITIAEDERVLFSVTGTHSIFLTGNYVVPQHELDGSDDSDDDEDEMDYDLEPDSDELDSDEEDELDALENPRITEVDDEDADMEAPTLVKAIEQKTEKKADKKGKNKRPAEDDDASAGAGLDEMIAAAATKDGVNGEQKLTKAQRKKLKKNDGSSATAAAVETVKSLANADSDSPGYKKKVEFAKNLEQGPTPSKDARADAKAKPTPSLGVKTVQGVEIDDKKLGTGPVAKSGDKVGMRYIGKLKSNNKVFDSNKKGKPFTFRLGAGEVIKGWDIGIAGMAAGGERRITLPARLGYGSQGAPPDIPKNADLVFDVKLLEIGGKK